MTTSGTHILSLSDIDRVLPDEYEVLPPGDVHNANRPALRAVRHKASTQIYSFYSAQEYFRFAVSMAPRTRLLSEEAGTRYVQLSASYDSDAWFHASVTHTVAALTRSHVVLHRMKSDETAVRFVLTGDEMAALVECYQAYQTDCQAGSVAPACDPDPFLADPDEIG
jgi:hypothetical protein